MGPTGLEAEKMENRVMNMEQKSKRLERGAGIYYQSAVTFSVWNWITGQEAYYFVDQLKEAVSGIGRYWPVGPTSFGDSPYQSFSTFAGNPYFIDLDMLQEEGLLKKEEILSIDWGKLAYDVDYQKMYVNRFAF